MTAAAVRTDGVVPVPAGVSVSVRVPASSANLGAGFDCLGIALALFDEVDVTVLESGVEVSVTGEGSGQVPLDERHLVVRAIQRGLAAAGASVSGLKVECRNVIPHSRGLGSSASAAVAGVAAASGLLAKSGVAPALSDAQLVQLAGEFEGHPDNAAASALGGAVVSWTDTGREGAVYGARRVEVHPSIGAYAFVSAAESSTNETRGLLPDTVPRADAVFNVSRASLAVVALQSDPSLLMIATDDRLHQGYRASAMAPSAELVARLRADDVPAMISGAGPTVLAIADHELPEWVVGTAGELGFSVLALDVAGPVEVS